jgi:hypothetical protein
MIEPIAFVAQSFAVLDVELNAVISTRFGNLAIFSTRGVADHYAALSALAGVRAKVVPVIVKPVRLQ